MILRIALGLLLATAASPQSGNINAPIVSAPDRRAGEGDGPFDRLVIRGVTVIDGTGAQPRGPIDVVVERNRIVEVRSLGDPLARIDERTRASRGTREIDAKGMFLLPGFIDLHTHTGGAPKAPEAEYVYKLWMAHGVTTVRGVPSGPMDWTLRERERSAKNQIVAPRMYSYFVPFTGDGWTSPQVI